MLQFFFLLDGVGTLVYILIQMLRDIVNWISIYVVLFMSLAMLPLGIGVHETLIQHCKEGVDYSAHESDMKMTCFEGYSFYRTVLQSFGELFPEVTTFYTSKLFWSFRF